MSGFRVLCPAHCNCMIFKLGSVTTDLICQVVAVLRYSQADGDTHVR